MTSRAEITTMYAKAFKAADKRNKAGSWTRWCPRGSPGQRAKVLQRVWAASGGQCGKYLVASMRTQLDGLERNGKLVDG